MGLSISIKLVAKAEVDFISIPRQFKIKILILFSGKDLPVVFRIFFSYFAEIFHLSWYFPATDMPYFQYGFMVPVKMSDELLK